MIIDVTYACNMGCSHCMSDCTPDGLHMPIQTFRDSLNFLQTYKIPTWNFSGGEMFEHPQIMEILDVLEFKWTQLEFRCPICFITNGRKLTPGQRSICKGDAAYQKIWESFGTDSGYR